MALSQKLEIRQSQALVMTPQLMQAIKLLQLSNLDLSAYVDNELERNPLLERTAETEAAEAERRADRRRRRAAARPRSGRNVRSTLWITRRRSRREAAEHAGDDDDVRRPAGSERLGARLFGMGHARRPPAATTATSISKPSRRRSARSPTISAEQLALAITDPARRMIGQYLIDLVDEAGYLTGDLGVGRREARHLGG